MKSGTTSLYHDLTFAGIRHVPVTRPRKEFHFFDKKLLRHPTPKELIQSTFLSYMENCSGLDAPNARRSVLADFTPASLRQVPRPFDYVPRMHFSHNWDEDISMPWRLRYIYGDERASKVQFAILLREPLSQMQSAWYSAAASNFTHMCLTCKSPSFQASLRSVVAGLESTPKELTEWVWVTMYGRQIEHWISQFPASQFLVIPWKYYIHGDKDAVCQELSSRL